MKDGPIAAVPPLAAGDLYLYSHGNGAIFVLEHDGRSRLVTLGEALAVATACDDAGCRVVVGADEGPLAMDVIAQIITSGVPVVPFDAPTPPHKWPNGGDALKEAAQVGSHHILDDLIERGADLDGRDNSGSTALHHAAAYGNTHAVDALLRAGADPNVINARGLTPYATAMAARERPTAERLATLGADAGAGVRDEVRFSLSNHVTVVVWVFQLIGIPCVATVVLWPLSFLDVAGIVALVAAYLRFVFPPRVFWSGGVPRRLLGTTLTLRRFIGSTRDVDLADVTYAAVGGSGGSVHGARWFILGHPSGRPASDRMIRRLYVPATEVDEVAAHMDRVVVIPAYAVDRENVLLAMGNVLSGLGVDMSPTFRQQLADARAKRDAR